MVEALGVRSPVEEEHGFGPSYMVAVSLTALQPDLRFVLDDVGRVPMFAEKRFADICADHLRQFPLFGAVEVVPVWWDVVGSLLKRSYPNLPDAQLAMHAFVVEATTLGPDDAERESRETARRIMKGIIKNVRDEREGNDA